jgi:hypothetical protein
MPQDVADRLQRLYSAVSRHDDSIDSFRRLQAICHACVDVLPVEGAGVMLLAAAARAAGIEALFSFPLQIDDASMGALNLYRSNPGDLRGEQADDARLLAAMATREVLGMQAAETPGALPTQVADLSGDRVAIEQATGMVAAQTNTDIVEAARRLRTLAVQRDSALAQVAHDIVARALRAD